MYVLANFVVLWCLLAGFCFKKLHVVCLHHCLLSFHVFRGFHVLFYCHVKLAKRFAYVGVSSIPQFLNSSFIIQSSISPVIPNP